MTSPRRALVLADGAPPSRVALDEAWPGWADDVDLVVAADGGARLADRLGLAIDRWVGDGDSLGEAGLAAIRRAGVAVDLVATEKDATDTELALLAANESGAPAITILGALGGPRPDHAIANVVLLGHPAVAGREVLLLDPAARMRLVTGPSAPVELAGRIGDLVSIVPLETALGVTTGGLRYALHRATLPFGPARGVSNVRTEAVASVGLEVGRILVIEAPATFST